MLPEGTPEDPYPEVLVTAQGKSGHSWVHAKGYIHAPLAAAWQALNVREVCVDRHHVDRYSISEGSEEGYDHSFAINAEVDDIITVEFRISWRQGVVEGTNEDPIIVAARFQKTFGTPFIKTIAGSVVMTEVTDEVTEFQFIEHVDSASGDEHQQAKDFMNSLYDSLRAQVRGEPLP